ncbi:MAG: HAD family hydrolase [Clostridiales bacterium]|nr:HAD family hydrolase [Clostridiales bacterium]
MANYIFDYDGTLHETIRVYEPAFRKAYEYLARNNLMEPRTVTTEEIASYLGFSAKDMWDSFAPEISEEDKLHCSSLIGDEIINQIKEGNARLYSNAIDTLKALKAKGNTLIFLSNCKEQYMNENRNYFGLDRFFDDYYCCEKYDYAPKYEIFSTIKEKHSGEFIVIGDRFHDMEIAQKHNLKSVGCLYGYGSPEELECASVRIDDISQILSAEVE